MQRFIYPISAGRALRTTFILMLLLLLGTVPSYAQSEPNAPTDPASEVFNAAIAAPSHIAPTPDAVTTAVTDPPVGVPTLSWSAIPGATQYNVQISVSAGFADFVVNENTEATSYTPKVVIADGTYFWHVRAEIDDEWGNFSAYWSFRKDWSNGGTITPQLLAPAHDPDGQHPIASFSPEHFSWSPVPGAAAYLLEISVSSTFNDVERYKVTTLKTHHTPTTQFANNRYFWRVTAIDSRDHAGEPSEVRAFTFNWNQIPELLTPVDDLDVRFMPRFTWKAIAGASSYILEIGTQEKFAKALKTFTTRNTSFSLEETLPNDKDYFWRVRAVSPQGVNSPLSEERRFHANWVEPPLLLSPPLRSINHIYPYFSWTPVVGAEEYQLQIARDFGFADLVIDITLSNATSYTQPKWDEIDFAGDYIWHVRAKDAKGNATEWSSDQGFYFAASPPPNLIYPEPYYEPDATDMPVHTDRTIGYPIFVWDTTHQWIGSANGGNGPTAFVYPDYYRLEVATTSDFSNSNIVFKINSAGQGAAPTETNPFTFADAPRYYWRVTPILAGTPMAEGTVWETRIDPTLQQLPLDSDTVPDISHPQDGLISVDTAPIMGWLPVAGADYYEVEISVDQNFTTLVDSARALFPYYVPWQGRLVSMPPGTYWWHVRARNAANTLSGDWTVARHFFVTHDLMTGNEHDYVIPNPGTLLDVGNPLMYDAALSLVATDTLTVSAPYNVGELHIVQDRSLAPANRKWVIAFGADEVISTSLTYEIYLDVNQLKNVGATNDPRGKPITTDVLYLPEYVIYLERTDSLFPNAIFYEWRGGTWVASSLAGLNGSVAYDPVSKAVQVEFPYATIILNNEDQFSGAIALTVFSAPNVNNAVPVDSSPQQSMGGANVLLNHPALVSNIPVPLFPFDTPMSNPIVFHELPTLRWRMPHYNSVDGYIIEIARTSDFTPDAIVQTWSSFESNTTSYYGAAPTAFHSGDSYNDNESYYWRVQYRHERYDGTNKYDVSPWSQPMRFKLTSYLPGNPAVTLGNPLTGEAAQATPTFTWDRVEGAARYSIQIADDSSMDSLISNKTIDGNSYTQLDTLADGSYYWRVAMRRSDNVLGQWTSIMSFTKTSLVPTLISPVSDPAMAAVTGVTSSTVINNQPTFIWATTISNDGELRIAAPRYRLQWDDNSVFNSPTTIETEATSYTPTKGQSLNDGTWFWRVAVIDGNGRPGPYSAIATFYKEYLRPETLSPIQGSSESDAIFFEWSPLNGAAFYKLEIDNNEAFDSPIRVSTDNTRYTHNENFAPDTYYWRVQMVDKDNKPGPTIAGGFTQGPETSEFAESVFIPMILGSDE